ncbi:YafY family protein [Thomasclavelia sp.]|uniref:helix-turn-helix transcriptional regulator n=1 Tax=Thomasclavelia sp. TaxID=3025757 RepID=UPI0025E59D1F|nr:YafY family protein [Thomasclavelia sp.]
MTNSRLFELLYFLLDKRQTTADELADHFEISKRTVYRDLQQLMVAGFPVYSKQGHDGGIYLDENFVLQRDYFSEDERIQILTALQTLANLKGANDDLVTKLVSLFGTNELDWLEIDFSSWHQQNDLNAKFNLLKEAIISKKQITFDYVNTSGLKTKRNVYPLKLYFKATTWYLQGYCVLKKANRFFKLTRIRNLKMLNETFITDQIKSEKIETYLHPQKTISITLLFSKELASAVFDEFNEAQITKLDNGDYQVVAEVEDSYWLDSYILSFGSKLKVLSPNYLRSRIEQEAKKIIDLYI